MKKWKRAVIIETVVISAYSFSGCDVKQEANNDFIG